MKRVVPFLLIIFLALPAARYLLGQGYFNMHDDLQVMRIYQFEKCLADGQIPCRWSPDMAYGYGQAMFNFYSTFPYYLGALMRIIAPFSIMETVLLLFLISLILSAFGMYFLAKQFWGKLGGIVAAVLYTYAPYHGLDIFIRGALAESFSLAILPFIWLFIYLVIKKASFQRVVGLTLSLAILFTTHNVSSLMYAPFTAVWALFWIVYSKKWKSILGLGLGGVLALGISAFFLLPVLFEQSLIQKEFFTMDYLDYNAHFVSIRQLFLDRAWGHGPSIFGPEDELSFQIGWPHWWLAIPLTFIALFWFVKKRSKSLLFVILGLLGFSALTAFLTHSRSTPIWQAIPMMAFIQFPWRFLGPTIFGLSFGAGALVKTGIKFRHLVGTFIIILAIVLNFNYFKPWSTYAINDEEKLSGISFEIQQKSAILDYLPKTAPIAPKELAPEKPIIAFGEAETYNFSKRSNSFFFDAEVYQNTEIQIPVMYFPGWKVISEKTVIPSWPSGDYGLITIELPQGKHIIRGRFENTPVRDIGNTISILSTIIIFSGFLVEANKKKSK